MAIPKDKILHAVAGALIGIVTSATGALLAGYLPGVATGSCLAVVAGVGKELYDRKRGGTVDSMDAVATGVAGVIGAVLGALVSL